VHFAGWQDRAAALMHACDVVVIPSRFEGFGMVALEAMAASRPIVATSVDALREVIADGETGLLVPVGDAGALARAVTHLLQSRALAEDMGRAGRQRLLDRFSLDRMIEATLAVYRRLS
jgi:glycosyltransferase involved in cell wall biosynthesis